MIVSLTSNSNTWSLFEDKEFGQMSETQKRKNFAIGRDKFFSAETARGWVDGTSKAPFVT